MADLVGVDAASYQGAPAAWRGAAGKISFAAIKITELEPPTAQSPQGVRYINSEAAADLDWLKSAGHLRIFYLFAHPAVSAAETVSFFAQTCRALRINESDDAIAVDLEVTDGRTPAEVSAWAREVLSGLEANLHRKPLIYSYLSFIEAGNLEGCGRYPLWMSDPSSPAGHPRVPAPFKVWTIHQYSTSAPIDRDIAAYKTREQMGTALGKHAAAKLPAVRPHTHPVILAARAVRNAVSAEPVLTAATGNTAAAAVIAWVVAHLGLAWSADQKSAALTIVTALAAALTALATRPWRVTVFTGALGTAAVAFGAFGLHISPEWIAGEMPVAAAIVGGILRGHVSPASKGATATAPATAAPGSSAATVSTISLSAESHP